MKITNLLGYAAAIAMLAWGFSSCSEDNPEDEKPDTPTTTVNYRVSVDDDTVTETSVTVRVTCSGTESDTWYVFATDDLDSPAADAVQAAVSGLHDIPSVLHSRNASVEITGLTAGTTYRVIVTGLLSDGTVTGTPASDEFTTSRDPNAWTENPDWTVAYVDRGTFDVSTGSTKYGDRISVTVPEDNSDFYYLMTLSRSDFESEYSGNVATLANAIVEELNAYVLAYNEAYPDSPASIMDLLYDTGGMWILDPLSEEEWYLFMIGIEPSGVTGEGSGLYAQSEAFVPAVEEASAEYNKWLGTWTITGKNLEGTEDVVQTLVISAKVPEYQYEVKGWQDGLDEVLYPFTAQFNKNSSSLSFIAEDEIGSYNDGTSAGYVSFYGTIAFSDVMPSVPEGYPDETYISGGPYTIATATMSDDNNASFPAGETLQLTSGASVTLRSMAYYVFLTEGEYAGYFNYWNMPVPHFPMTMTRAEGSAASVASARTSTSMEFRSAKVSKAAPAAYRIFSPLKTVYYK